MQVFNTPIASFKYGVTAMLPDDIIAQLDAKFPCREQQLRHLAALYSVGDPGVTESCLSD